MPCVSKGERRRCDTMWIYILTLSWNAPSSERWQAAAVDSGTGQWYTIIQYLISCGGLPTRCATVIPLWDQKLADSGGRQSRKVPTRRAQITHRIAVRIIIVCATSEAYWPHRDPEQRFHTPGPSSPSCLHRPVDENKQTEILHRGNLSC